MLSVPVTYASMKNKDIDVFLGNWMPSQEADRKPSSPTARSRCIGANLAGAKYTLAVPAYTYEAGLKDFADIQRFAPQLNHSIYGIEPGNDGNRLMLGMHQAEPVRPRQLQADRIQRAGHAGRSRARHPRARARSCSSPGIRIR